MLKARLIKDSNSTALCVYLPKVFLNIPIKGDAMFYTSTGRMAYMDYCDHADREALDRLMLDNLVEFAIGYRNSEINATKRSSKKILNELMRGSLNNDDLIKALVTLSFGTEQSATKLVTFFTHQEAVNA